MKKEENQHYHALYYLCSSSSEASPYVLLLYPSVMRGNGIHLLSSTTFTEGANLSEF